MGYTLLVSLIEYKTLVMRGDLERASEVLPSIPKEHHNRCLTFEYLQNDGKWRFIILKRICFVCLRWLLGHIYVSFGMPKASMVKTCYSISYSCVCTHMPSLNQRPFHNVFMVFGFTNANFLYVAGSGNNMFGGSLKLLVLHRSAIWFLTIIFWVNLNKVFYVYILDLNVMCIIIILFFNTQIILL